ncbi:MAG: hypothetical protein PHH64_04765 [Proteiniphilum sp.]|nr:hypothetical protein [Proteiniphilum sp.]MDD4158703.1 hypothetical protein [Proteiniphilum sp.]MDD4800463.1 hypothetical protein [Proteiniphilum sp.]
MDLKHRNIFLLLFMLAFIATIVVYFSSDKDMKLTWYFGGAAILCYLIYRFSKK